jgi:hypothetical protein
MIILVYSGIIEQLCRPNLDRETLALKSWFVGEASPVGESNVDSC